MVLGSHDKSSLVATVFNRQQLKIHLLNCGSSTNNKTR
uniref:Uncharacterized protein n=1 Tax=Arundo donax TaxID=35708 RepID=A0A0A9AUE5_ARUDO